MADDINTLYEMRAWLEQSRSMPGCGSLGEKVDRLIQKEENRRNDLESTGLSITDERNGVTFVLNGSEIRVSVTSDFPNWVTINANDRLEIMPWATNQIRLRVAKGNDK